MGFDLYWANEPEAVRRERGQALDDLGSVVRSFSTVDERLALANEVFRAAESTGSYFRVNNSGMRSLLMWMQLMGMLKRLDRPKESTHSFDPVEDELRYRAGSDTGPGGIPHYKLCSNDGWLITPAEIAGALEIFDALGDAPPDDVAHVRQSWDDWIVFLRAAAEHGGVLVT